MNLELMQLVNNFSQERIDHLKKVVGTVKREEIQKMKAMRSKESRAVALGKIRSSALRISQQLKKTIMNDNKWKLEDVTIMEREAKNILAAVQQYKNNK